MGLEMVEVMMECEDEFGIEIPDRLASNVRTVGDLRDLIVLLAAPAGEVVFEREQAHTGISRAMASAGVGAKTLDEQRHLKTCVLGLRRHVFWTQLQQQLSVGLPRLRVPPSVTVAALGLTAVSVGVGAWRYGCAGGLIAGIAAALLGWMVGRFALRFTPAFPPRYQTIGHLVEHIVRRKSGATTPDAVLARLQPILSEQLGIREAEIQPEDRFLEDLNCG